jgi:heme-degrading monooxygenase HmoA
MITVGMNYEVLEGKHDAFEQKFALVVQALETMAGHVATHLYQQIVNRRSYLVVSEWETRAAFDAFVSSDAFRRTTAWGSSGILATRPRHQVYGGDELTTNAGCPAGATESKPTPPLGVPLQSAS